jgi:hypothetical protein
MSQQRPFVVCPQVVFTVRLPDRVFGRGEGTWQEDARDLLAAVLAGGQESGGRAQDAYNGFGIHTVGGMACLVAPPRPSRPTRTDFPITVRGISVTHSIPT